MFDAKLQTKDYLFRTDRFRQTPVAHNAVIRRRMPEHASKFHHAGFDEPRYTRAYATLWTADWYSALEPSELKTFQKLARLFEQILQIWLASKSATAFTLTHLLPDHPFWDLGDFDWIGMNSRSSLEESILDASLLPSRLSTLKDVLYRKVMSNIRSSVWRIQT